MKYHSALKSELQNIKPASGFIVDKSYGFVHNLINGLPTVYSSCDLIYADLPWKAGYQRFMDRAGVNGKFEDFIKTANEIAENITIPVIYVTGRHARHYLNSDKEIELKLNGSPAIAYIYRGDLERHGPKTAFDLIQALAENSDFQCIGDPCCGYGRAPLMFHRANKRFVASDVNPKCIGFLAKAVRANVILF